MKLATMNSGLWTTEILCRSLPRLRNIVTINRDDGLQWRRRDGRIYRSTCQTSSWSLAVRSYRLAGRAGAAVKVQHLLLSIFRHSTYTHSLTALFRSHSLHLLRLCLRSIHTNHFNPALASLLTVDKKTSRQGSVC